jgi:hypothetical protein
MITPRLHPVLDNDSKHIDAVARRFRDKVQSYNPLPLQQICPYINTGVVLCLELTPLEFCQTVFTCLLLTACLSSPMSMANGARPNDMTRFTKARLVCPSHVQTHGYLPRMLHLYRSL